MRSCVVVATARYCDASPIDAFCSLVSTWGAVNIAFFSNAFCARRGCGAVVLPDSFHKYTVAELTAESHFCSSHARLPPEHVRFCVQLLLGCANPSLAVVWVLMGTSFSQVVLVASRIS